MRRRLDDHSPSVRPPWARLIGAMLLLTSVGAIACGSGDATGPEDIPTDISGTYVLADVGGNKVPTSVYQGPFTVNGQKIDARIDVVGSTLELNATRYVLSVAFLVSAQNQQVPLLVADTGSYSKQADVIAFTSPQQKFGRLTGSIQNGNLKVAIDLVGDGYPPTYLFRK